MTSIRKPKRYENIWTKTIAILILIALCIGMLWIGYHGIRMYDVGIFDKSEYLDTSRAFWHAEGYASDIESSYFRDKQSVESYGNHNFGFTIYQTDSEGIYKPVYSSEQLSDKYHTYEIYINYRQADYNNDAYTVFHDMDGITKYLPADRLPDYKTKIEIRVYDPPTYFTDIFSEEYTEFTNLHKNIYKFLTAGVIGLILIIFDLVFIISSAGYDYSYDGIIMNFVDKMPYDLFTGVIVLLAVFTVLAFEPLSFEENLGSFALLLSLLILLGLYGLTWLVSTVKRIKNRTLLKNTLTYMVGYFIFQIVVKLRLVWKTALFMCVYGLSMMFLVTTSDGLWLAIIISVIVCLYILWWLIKADEIKINTEKIAKGRSEGKINTKYMPPALTDHAENINSLHDGIKLAVDREMKSEHLKTELITNVSHDIKTPLTSIINYIDLLQKEHTDEEEEKYLEVLSRQSDRLKKLIEDLIEASKASTGNISAELTRVNVNEIISQSLSEYSEKMESLNLEVIVNNSPTPLFVLADGNLLWRILNNLYNNICKYAMPDTRVYIDVVDRGSDVNIEIKNISREMLNIDPEELMERFVRGDSSRHTEGSGLGLNIAGSLAEIMNGKLSLSIDGDLFKSTLSLPKA
ncbi:MAG: HAMP domain-containing histidine kinase [Erysipelotrichaceae bacterium]|nr:HAMP domain-containing histidine kinase [Erysipelotrichaceae bacterium]